MIYLIAYLIVAVFFAAAAGSELGIWNGIVSGFLWPLTIVVSLFMLWVGSR